MVGYIFKVTSLHTGKYFYDKYLSVRFDKNYYGKDMSKFADIGASGPADVTVEMVVAADTVEALDLLLAAKSKELEPVAPKKRVKRPKE